MGCGYVLVVDGDAAWRSQTAALLARAGFGTVGVSSGADALAAARRARPVLVLLELTLPDVDGYEVCRELREELGDATPIVTLSADRIQPHDRIAALLIGADDALAKPCDPGELLARVRRLTARGAPRGGDGHAHVQAALPENGFGLTRRELEVLRLLADGLPHKAIAVRLVISPKTVSSHIQRILAKLGVHSRAQAVVLAHREGLVDDFVAHGALIA